MVAHLTSGIPIERLPAFLTRKYNVEFNHRDRVQINMHELRQKQNKLKYNYFYRL